MSRAGWIATPKYDLGLLTLPPLLGIFVCALAGRVDAAVISGVSLFLLGMPHYLSTYSFYFDDANAAYARTRWLAFYAGPVVIVVLLTLGMKLGFYLLVALWVDAWNVFHVSRQSSGILSVYRHLNGGDNRLEKTPANLAMVCIAAGLYSIHIARQPSFAVYLERLPFDVMPYIGPALLAVGVGALGLLLIRMSRRSARLLSPEMLFIVTSALLFLPYVLIDSRSTAASAMLSGHYIQYMGLLWLMNHRKYTEETGSWRQRMLVSVSRSAPRIVGVLVLLFLAATAVDRAVHGVDAVGLHNWILNLVVLLHFYLDGLIWAFKQPHTRQTIGPYLLLPDHRVAPQGSMAPVAVPAAS